MNLIKIRKEGGWHPAAPSHLDTKVCFCGGIIYSSGLDINDNPLYSSQCYDCFNKRPSRTPEEQWDFMSKVWPHHVELMEERGITKEKYIHQNSKIA